MKKRDSYETGEIERRRNRNRKRGERQKDMGGVEREVGERKNGERKGRREIAMKQEE